MGKKKQKPTFELFIEAARTKEFSHAINVFGRSRGMTYPELLALKMEIEQLRSKLEEKAGVES